MIRPDDKGFEIADMIQNLTKYEYVYGNISILDLIKKIKGTKIHCCPKCKGRGYVTEEYDAYPSNFPDSGWAQDIQTRKVKCNLCGGFGWTEDEYVPNEKIIIDGYRKKD